MGITVQTTNDYVEMTGEFSKALAFVKSIQGRRWVAVDKVWVVPMSSDKFIELAEAAGVHDQNLADEAEAARKADEAEDAHTLTNGFGVPVEMVFVEMSEVDYAASFISTLKTRFSYEIQSSAAMKRFIENLRLDGHNPVDAAIEYFEMRQRLDNPGV